MNITLNIDEKLFNESGIGEAIKESFNKLTDDELSDIMKDILHQYLSNEEILKNYFIKKQYDSWTHRNEEYPSENFVKMINKIDLSEEMDDIKDRMINILNNDLNKILTDLFARSFVNSIYNMINTDNEFKDDISNSIHSHVISLMNANKNG